MRSSGCPQPPNTAASAKSPHLGYASPIRRSLHDARDVRAMFRLLAPAGEFRSRYVAPALRLANAHGHLRFLGPLYTDNAAYRGIRTIQRQNLDGVNRRESVRIAFDQLNRLYELIPSFDLLFAIIIDTQDKITVSQVEWLNYDFPQSKGLNLRHIGTMTPTKSRLRLAGKYTGLQIRLEQEPKCCWLAAGIA